MKQELQELSNVWEAYEKAKAEIEMANKPIQLRDISSLCQKWCYEACLKARVNLYNKNYDGSDIAGVCPAKCSVCLYMERFNRDDANWIPHPTDPQYHHWYNR